ncbi:acyl-CoA dehydrogenase family protein [Candidatus Nitrospira inopinata]|jgi:alkylation response protein AidB-like acyl-CoA dehydrogenase|uniref:Putative Acyl-CoA dehydrogenase n=1 Tax=Candidatus Nitrospira inopinata TaxID=1715989 RepID=A0A0S4KUB9_9BACT|nr:acyl-CoA dehydrogenase family protein [Candidatus Nitrospira inopinata]CUQ65931.1 putative Acyl-CoA dehydrogenase [Candidatus Nitrospira inopinata]
MASLFKGFERIEEARERLTGQSFMTGLFMGHPDFALLLHEGEPPDQVAVWEAYRPRLTSFLTSQVDPDEIERTGKIPESVLKGLFTLGAFAMKIPPAYGGLGFSYTNYGRALTLMASWSNVLALTVAVPQSIGIAMPLLLFGTEEQRRAYLPIVAREAISAFALTEPATGSDAANIKTEAVLDKRGDTFLVNGEKLWCTNGPIARYLTLIAQVPAKKITGEGKGTVVWVPVPEGRGADSKVPTAFVLDMETPGIIVRQRCRFEGCRGIENGHLTFTDVRIPAANLIGEVGRGLKYALTILNIGRGISIPAICLGMAKQAWQPTLDRANERFTFQKPLSGHQTQRMRLGRMAANLFAMESLAAAAWRLADRHTFDVRIEAAITKIFCSEGTIQFLKDAQIIFGGMGYETADSKRARGEPAFGIEQLVRDAEMYRIGEGATDVLRPFIAREGLGPHLERAGRYVAGELHGTAKLVEWLTLARFYIPWYLGLWRPNRLPDRPEFRHPSAAPLFQYIERTSRRLAKAIFWAMVRHGQALRDDQGRQNRIEMVAEDLLVIAAATLQAASSSRAADDSSRWRLVELIAMEARERIDCAIREIRGSNHDQMVATIGEQAAEGTSGWLSDGIIPRRLRDYRPAADQASLTDQTEHDRTPHSVASPRY